MDEARKHLETHLDRISRSVQGMDIYPPCIIETIKNMHYGNITFTEKPGSHIVIGSILATFERPIGSFGIYLFYKAAILD